MPDYIVKSHIDTFLKTDTLSGARSALGVPGTSDFQTLCSIIQTASGSWSENTGNSAINTLVQTSSSIWSSSLHTLSGDIISIHQESSILNGDTSLDEYIVVNLNGKLRTIKVLNNLTSVYQINI
jgi:hypothetical protein